MHSYEQGHICGQPQADGVVAALEEQGLYPSQVEVLQFHMDTKKTHTTPEAMAERGRMALEKIAEAEPDVVVTLDDNAFRQVGLPLVGKPGVSVVFSGLNGQPEDYDAVVGYMDTRSNPGGNVTGVYEKLHLKQALTVLKGILPSATRAVGITDTSPTGKALVRQFEIEAAEGLPMQWQVVQVATFEEYKDLIRKINADDSVQIIYPVALTLPTTDGGRVTAEDIFRWTLANSEKLEVALNYYFSRLGLLGGASVDFRSMGHHAGTQVARILKGAKAGDLAIVDAPDCAIVFNLARARELGLDIDDDILMATDKLYHEIELKQ